MVIKLRNISIIKEFEIISIETLYPRVIFKWPLCGIIIFDLDKNKILRSRSNWKCDNWHEVFTYWVTELNQNEITPKLKKRITFFLSYGK
jgi:hypothetical protein